MTPAQRIGATAVLGALAAASSLAGLFVLNTGVGAGAPPLGFAFSNGYDDTAYRRMSGRPTPADLSAAAQLSARAVALSPYASAPRLRLAYIDSLQHGRLTETGVRQFSRSYDLTAIDPDVAAWRIRFGLEHWDTLPGDTRLAVAAEAEAFAKLRGSPVNVAAVLSSVRDPSGRLAAAYWMRSWDAAAQQAPEKAAVR
jgi:hypothetical protein